MANETAGRMSAPYFTNSEIRKEIDEVLQKNASMFAHLGQDTPKIERERAKRKERQRLQKILHLDPTTVGTMLID